MTLLLLKAYASFLVVWTIMALVIIIKVEPSEAPPWVRWVVILWCVHWFAALLLTIFGAIWGCPFLTSTVSW